MFKLLLIWRYFLKKRVAWMAVIAVTLLVMLILVVLSVMSGLVEQARFRNHTWAGDLILTRDSLVGFPYYEQFISRLRHLDSVRYATPIIKTFALIDSTNPLQIVGLKPSDFDGNDAFTRFLKSSPNSDSFSFEVPANVLQRSLQTITSEHKYRGCYVGTYAPKFPLGAPLRLTVFALNSKGVLTGSELGENQTFWQLTEHKTGLLDVDEALLVDFDELQNLCWMAGQDGAPPRANEIRIRLKPGLRPETLQSEITRLWRQFVDETSSNPDHPAGSALLADVTVRTWRQYRRDFIAPMEKEKSLMIVVFSMIGFVAVFIVFAIFYMIVTEKIKDLGIVKSIGGSQWGLAQIFLGYGALVGLVGAALGTTLGWNIVTHSNQIEAWLNKHFQFKLWDPEVYAIVKIPDVVDTTQALIIAAIAILTAILGAAVPARRAAKLVVVEALRVE